MNKVLQMKISKENINYAHRSFPQADSDDGFCY
jgi:hypothetical protein